MNRYDVASVAKFNPLSFQEILLAPSMMRQKHDASIIAAEANRLKLDPLEQHTEEALRLKQEMDARINSEVDNLNKEGFNPTSFQNISKLNREYQDLILPTGRAGQINNAKVIYNKEKEEFMKSASNEKIGKDRAELLWKAKTSNYTGYDEDGKKITTVTPQGVAAFQDYDKDAQVAHSLLGKTVQGISSSGHHLEEDGTGGFWEVTKNGERIKSENTRQIEAAQKAFEQSWLRGEGAKYAKDAGLNIDQNKINNTFKSMLETSDIYKSSESANYNKAPEADGTKPNTSSLFGEDYNTTETTGESFDASEILNIGKRNNQAIPEKELREAEKLGADAVTKLRSSSKYAFKSEDIKDPKIKAIYDKTFKDLSTKGVMIDGKLTFLKSDFVKKGKDDPATAALVLKALKQNSISLTSKLLTTNQVLNDQGFVAGLGSTADDVDKNIRRQLQRDDASGRKLIDPKTGEVMSWNEIAEKYDVENINDVNYQGQISAHNWEEDNDKLGTNSKFSPHVVTIKTKDGWKSFKTTRLNSDNIGGNVARQNDLTKNYRKATLNHGDFIDFESSSKNLNGIRVKYNPKEQEYDPQTGELKSWTIDFNNGTPPQKATESQYMNWVNSVQ